MGFCIIILSLILLLLFIMCIRILHFEKIYGDILTLLYWYVVYMLNEHNVIYNLKELYENSLLPSEGNLWNLKIWKPLDLVKNEELKKVLIEFSKTEFAKEKINSWIVAEFNKNNLYFYKNSAIIFIEK